MLCDYALYKSTIDIDIDINYCGRASELSAINDGPVYHA